MVINNFAISTKGSHRKTEHLATSGRAKESSLKSEVLVRHCNNIETAFTIVCEAVNGYNCIYIVDSDGNTVATKVVER